MSALPSSGTISRRGWSYFVHGLSIQSDLWLPELETHRASPDVWVRLSRVDAPDAVRKDELRRFVAPDGTFYCGENRIGVFEVRSGTEILVEPAGPRVDARMLRLIVLGTALRALLHQRGLLILHASVVTINGRGMAFMGDSGAGKSTIAAGFLNDGQRVVSDDIAAIDLSNTVPLIHPGVPQLKLSPVVATKLCRITDALSPLAAGADKLAWRKPDGWLGTPVPLTDIYELESGSTSPARQLEEHEALMALLRHSYGAQLGLVRSRRAAALHLGRCAQVARRIPVRTLSVRRDLDKLMEVVSALKEDASG